MIESSKNEKILKQLVHNWATLADYDPLYAILSEKGKNNSSWQLQEFFISGNKDANIVFDQIKNMKITIEKGYALDFGCGVGRVSQAFADKFENVIGVDISDRMIQIANKYNTKSNVKYCINQTDNLSLFKDEQFDFIYSNIVLQHIPKQLTILYLKEFSRVLNKNGLLVFQLPDRMTNTIFNLLWNNDFTHKLVYPVFQKIRSKVKSKSGLHPIPKNQVIRILEGKGLKYLGDFENRNSGPKWISYTYYATK